MNDLYWSIESCVKTFNRVNLIKRENRPVLLASTDTYCMAELR